MGFFSQIMCEVRQSDEEMQPIKRYDQPVDGQCSMIDNAVPESPSPVKEIEAEPSPTLDLSAPQENEDERRRAHEAAEAKRKAEFDARQDAKRKADADAMQKLSTMSDEQVAADAAKRVAADTEKLTRRNMKEMVCKHIQQQCATDADFARKVMHPRKSMIRCFKYINRKAREYAEQEMKDNGIERTGVYGCDVPDGLCYQWAVDYFNDPDAAEDKENEEKFTPKPFIPKSGKSKPKTQPKKPAEKPAPKEDTGMQQISMLEVV